MQGKKTVFLGCGKLGKSILRGLKARDDRRLGEILVSVTRESSKQEIENEFGIPVLTHNNQAIADANLVVLAMKPFQMEAALQNLARDPRRRTWVSLAAGLPLESVARHLPPEDRVFRAMPNTSAAFCSSMTLLYGTGEASAEVGHFFQAVGEILWLRKENLIDALTPLTASSPAFFYLLCEGFDDYLQGLELTLEERNRLIGQTVQGVAQKILNGKKSFHELLSEVATPGGMTLEGLRTLNEFQIREAFRRALEAAFEKSKSLASK
jgi:pyrroline-5-carboxylate reductase